MKHTFSLLIVLFTLCGSVAAQSPTDNLWPENPCEEGDTIRVHRTQRIERVFFNDPNMEIIYSRPLNCYPDCGCSTINLYTYDRVTCLVAHAASLRSPALDRGIRAASPLADSSWQPAPPKQKLKLDAFDIAWAGTIIGDDLVTRRVLSRCAACREQSPLTSWATMTIQFGSLGLTKWLEYKYPGHSTGFRIFKGVVVAVGTGVILNNLSK